MITKRSMASLPGAWIINPTDRGRKSIKNGKVYLNDGAEFLIELHNPLTSCVLCDIKLNGSSISKGGLVLKPGQRFYLDCFPDDKKKFIFNTYEVENTSESIIEAIAKNGLLEVRFYKEEVVNISNWAPKFDKVIEHHYHHYDYYPNYRIGSLLSGGTTGGNLGGCVTTNLGDGTLTVGSTYVASNINLNLNDTESINSFNCSADINYTSTPISNNISTNIETGRVEKGGGSSQEFYEVDMQFQSMCIASVILQILPESRRPIDTSEIVQPKHREVIKDLLKGSSDLNFCEQCGNKLKGSENFCPKCGRSLK